MVISCTHLLGQGIVLDRGRFSPTWRTGVPLIVAIMTLAGFHPPVRVRRPVLSSRWILMYAADRRALHYTVDDCVRLVAGVDSSGQPTRWLSTGAILLALYPPTTPRAFISWEAGDVPADGADWQAYLDSMVAPNGPVARLDSAVQRVEKVLGRLPAPYQVAVMVPYPDSLSGLIGFHGRSYNLRLPGDRAGVVAAYVDELARRMRSAPFTRVRLRGIYWLLETVPPSDTLLVGSVAGSVHAARLRFFWIPYFRAEGLGAWRRLGFDGVWLQPNYFFNLPVGPERMDSAYAKATAAGVKLEVELDDRIMTDSVYRPRLEPYLELLTDHQELRRGSLAIYEGAGAIIDLSRSANPVDRAEYRRFLDVVAAERSHLRGATASRPLEALPLPAH